MKSFAPDRRMWIEYSETGFAAAPDGVKSLACSLTGSRARVTLAKEGDRGG